MRIKSLLYGLTTMVPGLAQIRKKGTGGTDSARYCYSVWLRHLVMARDNGLNTHPHTIAELGPGDSLGIGLAALLSGCEKYFAFDVVKHTDLGKNLEIFDELVTLFRNRENIPGDTEFPKVKPYLENYDFPSDIFPAERLEKSLEPSRIRKIKESISHFEGDDATIQYKVPWYGTDVLDKESVDLIYSQAVLEHVDDLRGTYQSMRRWLKPTGFISHQVDFKCHGTANQWNGHWQYSDFSWKLIKGKRPYLINRQPFATHYHLLNEEGFKVVCVKKIHSESKILKEKLAPEFKNISDDDLETSGAFFQAIKIN